MKKYKVIPLAHGLTCSEYSKDQKLSKDFEVFTKLLKETALFLDKGLGCKPTPAFSLTPEFPKGDFFFVFSGLNNNDDQYDACT
jgi:hypothetical protein